MLLFFLPIPPLSGCSTTLLEYPSEMHLGLWYFKDSQKSLGPELSQPQGRAGKLLYLPKTNENKEKWGKGVPETAGAGKLKSNSSKCTNEPLSELSLAR